VRVVPTFAYFSILAMSDFNPSIGKEHACFFDSSWRLVAAAKEG
jgi:hypothetical protein